MFEAFKSALLGSKLRILLVTLVSLGVVIAAGVTLGLLGAPSVGGVHNQFGNVTDETTEIKTDLVVRNPNPIGVNLGGVTVSYDVWMNDVAMANGTKRGVAVGTGNSTVEFTTLMDNERIPAWWVSHVRNDESTTVRIEPRVRSGTLGRTFEAPPIEEQVTTDMISTFNSTDTRPVDAGMPVVSDPVAYVNETGARWGEVTEAETPIDVRLVVYNPKTTPVVVTEIGYEITMNGVTVGEGASQREHVIEGHSTEALRTRTAIRNGKLDEWWVSHLKNGQVTRLRIDFYAEIEFAGETFRVPLEEMTHTETIETDIFGTKNGSGDAGETGDATTEDQDPTTGADDTTATDDTTTTGTGSGTTSDGPTTSTTTDGTTDDGGGTTTDDGLLARTNPAGR